MKKCLFIARQLLIGILLLQLLNLGLCSEPYIDYNTATNLRLVCDPTETIVEWVVEWKKGNQDAFTYDHTINLKGLNKNFAWHTDMRHGFPVLPPVCLCASTVHQERLVSPFLSACIEILSPPPECYRWI